MKHRTSMYARQLMVVVGLIALCITLLGAGFLTLTYRYHKDESWKTLERDATYISYYANAALSEGMTLSSEHFRSYIASVAMITDSTVLLCQPDGRIVYAAGSNLPPEDTLLGAKVPSWAVNQLMTNMTYSGTTTFNNLLTTESFVTGVPILTYVLDPITGEKITNDSPTGILFIASDASSLLAFMRSTFQLFCITAVAVLLISVIICSVAVQRIVDPLKGMSQAAYQFAHGEVDTRFTEYANRRDEIGELAAAFNAMADSLAQAEQKRSEFVANVSHELKTPMTTIAGYTDGILDGTIPPEKEKKYLQIISDESRRLSRLVRRMLDISRIQSQQDMKKEDFDLCESMRLALLSMEQKITDRGLDVEADIPEDSVMVQGVNDLITQVIYNLLENATKFAAPGSTLYLGLTETGGDKAVVTVRNTGHTIPPEEIPLLFERFHKSDKSRSEDKDGYGLGLYVVKTILSQHKEKISVTSENGVTSFSFTVQLAHPMRNT